MVLCIKLMYYDPDEKYGHGAISKHMRRTSPNPNMCFDIGGSTAYKCQACCPKECGIISKEPNMFHK